MENACKMASVGPTFYAPKHFSQISLQCPEPGGKIYLTCLSTGKYGEGKGLQSGQNISRVKILVVSLKISKKKCVHFASIFPGKTPPTIGRAMNTVCKLLRENKEELSGKGPSHTSALQMGYFLAWTRFGICNKSIFNEQPTQRANPRRPQD